MDSKKNLNEQQKSSKFGINYYYENSNINFAWIAFKNLLMN